MTQALINNTEIFQNNEFIANAQTTIANPSAEASTEGTDKSLSQNFDEILDKTIGAAVKTDDLKQNDNEETALVLIEECLAIIDNISVNNNKEISSNDESLTNQIDIEKESPEIILFKPKNYEEIETEEAENTIDKGIDDILSELNIESIEANSDSLNNETMTQQESPEELGLKVMLSNSVEKADVTFDKTITSATNVKPQNVTPEKIIEQITKHIDSLKGNSGIKMVLNPESLGKVNLQIINTKDGLSAQFTVTTNEARNLLMKGLDGLKETLITSGIGVDNLSIKLAETEESSYNPDWTEQGDSQNQGQNFSRQQREEKEKGLFEKTIAENMKNDNGKV